MSPRLRLLIVLAGWLAGAAVGTAQTTTTYTSESAFLAALGGASTVQEGFEDDGVWGSVRTTIVGGTHSAPSVTSQGITWRSNHTANEITTSHGAARGGSWGVYSIPHGDQSVASTDFIHDGFVGSSAMPMIAVGGWFTGTAASKVVVLLDGGAEISLGAVGTGFSFYGVVMTGGTFTRYEFREIDGTLEDQRLIFADDLTIAGDFGAANNPPNGTIIQPAGNPTINVNQAVTFQGSASDPDGDAVTVLWQFGDGATSTALAPGAHTYSSPGSYSVIFTATDVHGLSDPTPATRTVTVNNTAPNGTIDQPTGNPTIQAGGSVTFQGSASDPDGDAVTVLWQFGDGSTSTALAPGAHTYSSPGSYNVTFTATDVHGLADPTPDTRTIAVTAQAGITVAPTAGLVTTEAGGAATFTVVLASQPTAGVTVALSSSDATEGTVSPGSVSFASGNWSAPQTVTVTGADDAVVDGDVAYTIVTAAAVSADGNYSGIDPADVSVTNNDNDAPGITVAPTAGLVTTETGGAATFTVVLASQPTAGVTVALSSSDVTEGTVSPGSVSFTSGNWSAPQTVTVTGVDDAVVDGDVAYTIVTAAAVSSGSDYSGIDPADVSVTNNDNDAANHPPEGTILQPAGDVTVAAGDSVYFQGSAQDPDGDAVSVLWTFGDGTSSNTLEPGDHTYASAGAYDVRFTATDSHGAADPTPAVRRIIVQGGATPAMDGVVSGVADIRGYSGSDWHTDLYLHNSSAADVVVELYFCPAGGAIGEPVTRTVAPDRTDALADVVSSLFGAHGSGAVFWRVAEGDAQALLINANTYNRVDEVRRYGQQVPGLRWAEQPPAGTPVSAPAIAGRYRTNLGIAADGDCTQVVVRGFDSQGSLKVERTIDVTPTSWRQLDKLFRGQFPGLVADPDIMPVAETLHRFEVVGVDGKVVVYSSIVDNATNDGSYLLGKAPGEDGAPVWLTGVALVSGHNQSRWRSDVITFNLSGSAATTSVTHLPAGADNGGTLDTQSLPMAAGEGIFLGNILHDLFGLYPPAVGSLEASAAQGLFWMRTYTEETDPGKGVITYGQAVPVHDAAESIPAGGEGRVFGFTDDDRNRSNLILQNVCADDGGQRGPVTVDVEVVDRMGNTVATHGYPLQPGEYLQENRFLGRYGVGWLADGMLRVLPRAAAGACVQGGVIALVSEVNGSALAGTNDSRLLDAEVIAGR